MLCRSPSRVQTKEKKFTAQHSGIASVPCGMCKNCRINQKRIWVNRIIMEQSCHKDSCFVTLTYDDQHLPDPPDLQKSHLQNYLKKLRYHIEPIKIRHLSVGEYGNPLKGNRVWNPHYHLAIFGLSWLNKNVLFDCWEHSDDEEHGVTVGELNKDSAAYIAGYTVKKIDKIRGVHPVSYGRTDEFMISSRKEGGIGAKAIDRIIKQLNGNKYWKNRPITTIQRGKKKYPLGRYLSNRLMDGLGVDKIDRKLDFLISQELFFRSNSKLNNETFELEKRGNL